jgi:mannan endo-1,4-beta-mannosidase
VIYGHQDDLVYGYTWKYEDDRSDIKDIVGDYPGLAGFELAGIELGHTSSLDDVEFAQIAKQIKVFNAKGGIITISCHFYNPVSGSDAWDAGNGVISHLLPGGDKHTEWTSRLDKLAAFLLTLKDDAGQLIPLIYRPFHEHSGSWFWWGTSGNTDEQYSQLYKTTIDYLWGKGVHNLLLAYSTDKVSSLSAFMKGYPGDDYVDFLTFDIYGAGGGFVNDLRTESGFVSEEAGKRGKLSAFAEFGGSASTEYTDVLGVLKSQKQMSYCLTWRHPYQTSPADPGITTSQHADLKKFYDDEASLFLAEVAAVV